MGGLALQKGLGAIHALAHPLGAYFDAHHGMLNAVLMPHVLRHNAPVLGEKMSELSRWLNLDEYTGQSSVIDWICELRQTLGISDRLSSMSIKFSSSELAKIAQAAVNDPCAAGNPKVMCVDEFTSILIDAS